jgi:hypothetical protein
VAEPSTIDLAAIKQRQQQTWATGDFSELATTNTILGELWCEAIDIRAGQRVLDVATGSGNTASTSCARGCPSFPRACVRRTRASVPIYHRATCIDMSSEVSSLLQSGMRA